MLLPTSLGAPSRFPPNWKAVNLVFLKIGYSAGGKRRQEWLAIMAGLNCCLLEKEKENKQTKTPTEPQ